MTRVQVINFYRQYGDAIGVRFVSTVTLGKLMKYLLTKIPKKFTKRLPDLTEHLRPCFVRFAGREFAVVTYEIGGSSTPLVLQVEIAVHEAEHAFQVRKFLRKGGKIGQWYREYYLDPEFRALQEGGANAAEAEVRYAMDGKIPEPPSLDAYYVTDTGQKLSDQRYRKHTEELKKLGRGGSTFESSRVALRIMRELGILSH